MALRLTAAVGLAVLIHFAWNAFRFGNPFEFGYDWAETIPVLPARGFLVTRSHAVPALIAALKKHKPPTAYVDAGVLVNAPVSLTTILTHLKWPDKKDKDAKETIKALNGAESEDECSEHIATDLAVRGSRAAASG